MGHAAVVPAAPATVVPGRLGVLGGTFDPVHVAHLAIADEAREVLGLERVLFVPAGRPWQKADRVVTDPRDRLAMVELAVAGNPAFAVSRLEVDRDGPTYTIDTLEALTAAMSGPTGGPSDLWLILSAEALAGLPTWRAPDRILELARLAVVPRGGASTVADRAWLAERYPGREDRAVFLDGPCLRLSATGLRARVAAGRSIRYLVPDAVAAYIGDHALYRDQEGRTDSQ
jgi:nicotinate-nucleotide adenylyltransferase